MSSQTRFVLLNIICLSVLLTLGKIVLDPTAGKRPFANFNFPSAIPLAGWDLVDSQPLIDRAFTTAQYDQVSAGRQYSYRRKLEHHDLSLHAEIRYVLNTNGDVMELIQQQTRLGTISETRTLQTLNGFYNSFIVQEQLHFTSCVNPRGSTTVTAAQFFHNRYTFDLQPKRLFAWGLGRENLLDQRCLWLHLSTPLQGKNRDQMLAVLQEAWQSLTAWGQAQFPKP